MQIFFCCLWARDCSFIYMSRKGRRPRGVGLGAVVLQVLPLHAARFSCVLSSSCREKGLWLVGNKSSVKRTDDAVLVREHDCASRQMRLCSAVSHLDTSSFKP